MFQQRYINFQNVIRVNNSNNNYNSYSTDEMNNSTPTNYDDNYSNVGIISNNDNFYDMQQQGCVFKASTTTSTVSFYPKGMIIVKYLIEAFESDKCYDAFNNNNNDDIDSKKINIIVIGKLLHEGDNIYDGLELAVDAMNGLRLHESSSQLPPPLLSTLQTSLSPSLLPPTASSSLSSSSIEDFHYTINQMKHPLSWQLIYGKKLMNDDYTMFY